MKISKKKLKQIIQEELTYLIKEELGNLSEKDDKVSKKISYLMDKEDKPQDQAVAIALSMKDRGELEEADKEDDTDDDEVSDEDALVLKGPKVDPLGDSLAARRLRAIARRKAGDK